MATLKISDLSVGDWVGVRCGTKINAFKVEEIRFNNIIHKYVALLNNKAYGLPITELHPIPITAEILEKNGIHRTYEDDAYAIFRDDGLWVVKYSDGDWELSTPPVCRVDIKYVHQLQHALRLAGVDKEINL